MEILSIDGGFFWRSPPPDTNLDARALPFAGSISDALLFRLLSSEFLAMPSFAFVLYLTTDGAHRNWLSDSFADKARPLARSHLPANRAESIRHANRSERQTRAMRVSDDKSRRKLLRPVKAILKECNEYEHMLPCIARWRGLDSARRHRWLSRRLFVAPWALTMATQWAGVFEGPSTVATIPCRGRIARKRAPV
jgi:hypothetical protein